MVPSSFFFFSSSAEQSCEMAGVFSALQWMFLLWGISISFFWAPADASPPGAIGALERRSLPRGFPFPPPRIPVVEGWDEALKKIAQDAQEKMGGTHQSAKSYQWLFDPEMKTLEQVRRATDICGGLARR